MDVLKWFRGRQQESTGTVVVTAEELASIVLQYAATSLNDTLATCQATKRHVTDDKATRICANLFAYYFNLCSARVVQKLTLSTAATDFEQRTLVHCRSTSATNDLPAPLRTWLLSDSFSRDVDRQFDYYARDVATADEEAAIAAARQQWQISSDWSPRLMTVKLIVRICEIVETVLASPFTFTLYLRYTKSLTTMTEEVFDRVHPLKTR